MNTKSNIYKLSIVLTEKDYKIIVDKYLCEEMSDRYIISISIRKLKSKIKVVLKKINIGIINKDIIDKNIVYYVYIKKEKDIESYKEKLIAKVKYYLAEREKKVSSIKERVYDKENFISNF